MVAVKIIAAIIGFIAGVAVYPYFDNYVLGIIAFVGSVAVGLLTYGLVVALLRDLPGRR